jgi:signal peptidase II
MRVAIFLVLATLGTALDLWTKHAIFAWRGNPGQLGPYWIVEPYVGIETAVNMGALFGLGQGFGWLFSAMGLIMGGIFGNLYDRLGIPNLPDDKRGGVRDWILLTYNDYVWPNFNIADSVLVIGAIMLAIHSFRNDQLASPSESKLTSENGKNAQ